MRVSTVGQRGIVFSFDDPYLTNVYVIIGDKRIFVCDTFCGPDSMQAVAEHLDKLGHNELPFVIFNSHSHYDHIWGNSFFKEAPIISHFQCPLLIDEEGPKAILDYASHMKGEVKLVPPDITFSSRLHFVDENVLFFHSPGHTIDSASCIDLKDKVLFVSDNVESPVPWLYEANLKQYLVTLQQYLALDWKVLVPGHDPVSKEDKLIRDNMDYLSNLQEWDLVIADLPSKALNQHIHNISFLGEAIGSKQLSSAAIAHYEAAIASLANGEETSHTTELRKRLMSIIGMK